MRAGHGKGGSPILVNLAEDIEQKGFHVVVERFVIQEQLAEQAQVLAVYLVLPPVHLPGAHKSMSDVVSSSEKQQHVCRLRRHMSAANQAPKLRINGSAYQRQAEHPIGGKHNTQNLCHTSKTATGVSNAEPGTVSSGPLLGDWYIFLPAARGSTGSLALSITTGKWSKELGNWTASNSLCAANLRDNGRGIS